jgi:microcystin-dependent protein
MALESATYIDGLVVTNPVGSDPLAGADDHLRLIKSTLKSTFPNITGPVTATHGELSAPFPLGGIILWSGSLASIPVGWVLCDGASGTPDLRDRFVVGAGLGYAVADTGGEATVALVTDNLPSHSHTLDSGTISSAVTGISIVSDGAHSHTVTTNAGTTQPNEGGDAGGGYQGTITSTTSTHTGHSHSVTDAGHTHTLSGSSGLTGSGTAHENRPPYYALAYIMKV